jgi:hypothetical protein
MPNSEDSLRTALRELAGQAGPVEFTAGPLIRRAARRRTRFAAVSGLCVLAVAAAVTVPATLRSGPRTAGARPSNSSAGVFIGRPWDGEFICGQSMPGGLLPGPADDGLRIVIGPVTRTTSGAPAVRWYLEGTSAKGSGPAIGPVSAGLLVVQAGQIIAAGPAPAPVVKDIGARDVPVPSADVYRDAPLAFGGGPDPGAWSTVWQDHKDYRVIVVATVWVKSGESSVAVRLAATAVLPPG